MSRSRKKYPITGVTTSRSEKEDKQIENRRLRKKAREHITHERYDRAEKDELMSGWFSKDGRVYWPDEEYWNGWTAEKAKRK